MDFRQVEREFQQLKAQYHAGTLSETDFKARLQDQMLQDEQGRWWMIGYESGQWYVHDGEKWVRSEPPISPEKTAVSSRTPKTSVAAPVMPEGAVSRPGAPTTRLRLLAGAGIVGVILVFIVIAQLASQCQAIPTPSPAPVRTAEPAVTVRPVIQGLTQPSAAAPTATAPTSAPMRDGLNFTTVVKIAGINWFNRMETGVNAWGKQNGVNANLVGPAQADAAQQIPIIEDLIAKKVDALCVIPMDPTQLDPVLKKAMDAGITIVTHEASNQKNMNFDIEAFDNTAFGAGLMDRLAAKMGQEGEYAVFVDSLGSKTHNEWADGGIAEQKAKYPKMKLVGDKNESYGDAEIAYRKAKGILASYPNIKGFEGSAPTDVAGIGRAVEEAGLQDKVSVVGASLPSIAGDLLTNGAIDAIGFWDPAVAGAACNQIALMLENGQKVGEGTDLGIDGYHKLKAVGKVLYGDAAVYVGATNAAEYPF